MNHDLGGPAAACLPERDRDPAVSEPGLILSDVPLLVEDLLLQARALVESGAPTEAIEAILEQVAALREGRC